MTSEKKELSSKPQVNSYAQKELDKAEQKFEQFNEECKNLTLDRMAAAPKEEAEPQTKLSQKEVAASKEIYLKPDRSIGSKEPFNEKFRDDYNFAKEYVCFVAENNEILGEAIELWTKRFPGQPAEFWKVPVNKPVWGPRYLAERLAECTYHRLVMQDNTAISQDGMGTYTGAIVVDSTKHRLNAYPASQRKSVFMGASGF